MTVSVTERTPYWIRLSSVVGWTAMIFAAGMAAEGLQRAYQERVETMWPSVVGHVAGCYLDRSYPFRSDGGGVNYGLRCRFVYSVNSVAYQSSINVQGKHAAAHVVPRPTSVG
jgi:hypothetical protein